MQYRDFVLEIDPIDARRYQVRVALSPAGQGEGTFELPFAPDELPNVLADLAQTVRSHRGAAAARELVPPGPVQKTLSAQQVGHRLFRALFSGQILSRYERSLGEIGQNPGIGLRIQLKLNPNHPHLARFYALPWEFLFQEDTRDYLSLKLRTPVVRYLDVPRPTTPPPPLPDALRILVAISSPEGYAPLDLQQERQHLERVWGASEAVQLTFLEHTDVETLHEALLTGRHHILHYMGHGDFEPSSGEGTLLFETPEGKPHALSGKALAVELKNFRTLRLVFLNACDTARATDAEGRDPFGGVATALVMGGLPAVVAMQFPISDRAAIVFSKMVYQRMAEGHPVDTAVAEGRLAIYRDDPETMEWGTPVLFLRSPDGRLFDTSPGVRATEDIPVSAITEAIAEATAESARERFRKLGQMPRLPKNRRLAIAGGLAMLLTLLVVGLVLRWRAEPSSTGSATGLALAILEPRNLSSQPEDQWIATTIAEILVTELALGGGVRTVAGDALARALHDLELDPAESLSVGDLDRLRRYLGIDYLLTGAYSLTTGDSSQLRLDLRLLEAATGDLWTSAGGNSPEGELFTLLGDLSRQLRRWLGAAKLSAPQRKVARASLPADPQARRLYAEGLARLRLLDALGARDLLLQATEAAPDHPLPYAALAEAWSELGYDTKARQAARRALQGAGELSDWQRRTIEARTAELEHEWQEAIEIRRELYRSRPKDLTAGLRLAEAQIADGANRDALETLAALHRLPGPAANDPRIDLTEADCRYRLGELRESKAAARRAVTRGRALGAGPLVARALRHEARALQDLGETAAADVSLAEAEELFTGSDDRRGAAMVRELRAFSLKQRGQLDVALALFESAHTIYLEIGDERRINTVAGTIGHVLLQQDRFAEAEKWLYDSFKALERIGASLEAGAQRTSLGYKLQTQGELELALKHYQAASELYAAAESRAGEAIALTNTAEIHYLRGDLDQARELHEQALAINRGIGDPVGEAYDTFRLGKVLVLRGQLSAARERFLEALAMQQDVLMAAEARLGLAALELLEGRAEKAEDTARRIVEELTQDEASALVARARHLVAASLLEQGKAWVAQQAFAPTRELATTSEDFLLRLESTLLAARLQAAGGEASSVAAALRQLESAAAEAAAAGFTGVSFEARWARVEIALEQRRPTADDQLEQLTADARAKGLGLYEQLAMQRQR